MRIFLTLLVIFSGNLLAMPLATGNPLGSIGTDIALPQPGESLVDRQPSKSAAQAATEARKRYGGGKVLAVEETPSGFRVKLLRQGNVRIVFVPR